MLDGYRVYQVIFQSQAPTAVYKATVIVIYLYTPHKLTRVIPCCQFAKYEQSKINSVENLTGDINWIFCEDDIIILTSLVLKKTVIAVFCSPVQFSGAAPGIFVLGSNNSGGLGGCGSPTTLTKSLDLHNYHNCHRWMLGGPDPRTP